MSSPREAKLQLTIHARVNAVTGERFKGKHSYAKIVKEYKNDSNTDAEKNVYILVRESKYLGFVTVDYGYQMPSGEFKTGSSSIAVDVRSPQTQPLAPIIERLFQERFILRDRRTATLRVLRPGEGEQLSRRSIAYDGMEMDEKLSSSPRLLAQPQVSLMQVPTLFANSVPSTSPVTATVESTPENFKCPITLAIMRQPALAADGYHYEESAIRAYIASQGGVARSPMDNVKPIQEAFPNNELRNRIHEAVLQSAVLAAEFWDVHKDAILNPQLTLGEINFADKFKRKYPEFLVRDEKQDVARMNVT